MNTFGQGRTGVACMLILWCWGGAHLEAADVDAALANASRLVEDGDFEQSVRELSALLEQVELSTGQRTLARKTLAEAHMNLRQHEEAVQVYKQIVRDDRTFNMRAFGEDPPAIFLKNFGQALLEVREDERRALEARLSRTSRAGALLRSAVLPGWGQRYQGYRNRGYMMVGFTAASIAYAVVVDQSYRDARDAYDGAGVGADFDGLYADYSDKADRADLALGIVAAVWLLNIVDAASQGPNITGPPSGLGLLPGREGGVQLAYRSRF